MLSKAAHAVYVASLCLAATTTTTTTTEAFLVAPATVKSAAATRGHQQQHLQQQRNGVSRVRCNTRAAATMKGDLDGHNDNGNNKYRSKLSALRRRLRSRTREGRTEEDEEMVAAGEEGETSVSMRARVQRRAQAVMRKSLMAVATAVIVRASFSPQAASAVGYKPRSGGAPSSRQVQCIVGILVVCVQMSSTKVCFVFADIRCHRHVRRRLPRRSTFTAVAPKPDCVLLNRTDMAGAGDGDLSLPHCPCSSIVLTQVNGKKAYVASVVLGPLSCDEMIPLKCTRSSG